MYVARKSSTVRAGAGLVSPWPESDAMTDMPEEASYAALIRAVATSRDRAAFAALFSHYAPRVKAFLQRRGADTAQAEELAQETLLAVWRKADQFDPRRATAAAWIFAIARNLRIDVLRRTRRAVPALAPDPTDDPPPSMPADAFLIADQRARRLREAIAALPAEQSEALRLAYFDERSHSEMESALAIPLGTVKSRLRLALARLRAALGEDA
jgi:RNA polymerase sigma-70 factor (ECF subfamily)